jgi:hypothetical protein
VQRTASGQWLVRAPVDDPLLAAVYVVGVIDESESFFHAKSKDPDPLSRNRMRGPTAKVRPIGLMAKSSWHQEPWRQWYGSNRWKASASAAPEPSALRGHVGWPLDPRHPNGLGPGGWLKISIDGIAERGGTPILAAAGWRKFPATSAGLLGAEGLLSSGEPPLRANNGKTLQSPVIAYLASWNDNGPVRRQRGDIGIAGEPSEYVGKRFHTAHLRHDRRGG